MQNDWILDVLADLKNFADANGLGALAQQLDDAKLIAAAEISSGAIKVHTQTHGDTDIIKFRSGRPGRHQHA